MSTSAYPVTSSRNLGNIIEYRAVAFHVASTSVSFGTDRKDILHFAL